MQQNQQQQQPVPGAEARRIAILGVDRARQGPGAVLPPRAPIPGAEARRAALRDVDVDVDVDMDQAPAPDRIQELEDEAAALRAELAATPDAALVAGLKQEATILRAQIEAKSAARAAEIAALEEELARPPPPPELAIMTARAAQATYEAEQAKQVVQAAQARAAVEDQRIADMETELANARRELGHYMSAPRQPRELRNGARGGPYGAYANPG
ncbi:uncharacterized protein EHS24_009488 [Apiotrichum porosum]|uniref:Uncharacterized protein n=1 Tax=Apiotrichum porosum TaxID=105984 RepID=A0A427XLX6_9TREE|nr:uncharacterized protein EHS24_009488 [Apiotrichum porosum]RSH79828.1 hypothetical protein EHS24_009488 [Apiotrichum porosum]